MVAWFLSHVAEAGEAAGSWPLTTALQVADMFTKQIFPKHFERLRRVMMGHENFDDMCERYQDAKAAGDNVDDPKVFYKPERPPK